MAGAEGDRALSRRPAEGVAPHPEPALEADRRSRLDAAVRHWTRRAAPVAPGSPDTGPSAGANHGGCAGPPSPGRGPNGFAGRPRRAAQGPSLSTHTTAVRDR